MTQFDRVAVINLLRRSDRLFEVVNELWAKWPSAVPTITVAVDGQRVVAPDGFTAGRYAWGCLQSHRRVLEDAINDGLDSVCVLEDDAKLADEFETKLAAFMAEVPDDWEMILLGGNHHSSSPIEISPNVMKPTCLDRTHAYIVRGAGLVNLYQFWSGWHDGFLDHALSSVISSYRCYCPRRWLAGQRAGLSDILRGSGGMGQAAITLENWWERNL